jgi:hypothetical protein
MGKEITEIDNPLNTNKKPIMQMKEREEYAF